jgi:hypothetical protein
MYSILILRWKKPEPNMLIWRTYSVYLGKYSAEHSYTHITKGGKYTTDCSRKAIPSSSRNVVPCLKFSPIPLLLFEGRGRSIIFPSTVYIVFGHGQVLPEAVFPFITLSIDDISSFSPWSVIFHGDNCSKSRIQQRLGQGTHKMTDGNQISS